MQPDHPRHRVSPVTTQRARRLRREMTGPEQRLWNVLRNRQLGGLRFRRQHPIGRYIVDFYCAEHALAIEVDGESHVGRTAADAARDDALRAIGVRVLRVTNDDVLHDVEAVARAILDLCES